MVPVMWCLEIAVKPMPRFKVREEISVPVVPSTVKRGTFSCIVLVKLDRHCEDGWTYH